MLTSVDVSVAVIETKVWYIHTMELYSTSKRKDEHRVTQTNLEIC